jgi:hypothetical protein
MTRIGASRRCSSCACAASPGTREPGELRVPRQRQLQRPNHLRVLVIELELVRQLQEPGGARIDGVIAMAETGRRNLARLDQPRGERAGGVDDGPAGPHERQAVVEQLPAGERVAAVVAAEAEDAGGHRAAERRPGRRRVAGGERRRRRRPMVEERHQHRVDQPAHRGARQIAGEQQIDGLAEGDAAHHLVQAVAADQDAVGLDERQRRRPGLPAGACGARGSRACHTTGLRNLRARGG